MKKFLTANGLRSILLAAAIVWGSNVCAQTHDDPGPAPQAAPQRPSADVMAREMTDRMGKQLGLNAKQSKKVYKLNLKYWNERLGITGTSNTAPPMRPEGMGPMGRPGGMGGPGSMREAGPGMQQPMFDRPRPDGDTAAVRRRPRLMNAMPEVSDEALAKRAAKFRKVLTPEQYGKWTAMEKARRNADFRRQGMPDRPERKPDAPKAR